MKHTQLTWLPSTLHRSNWPGPSAAEDERGPEAAGLSHLRRARPLLAAPGAPQVRTRMRPLL